MKNEKLKQQILAYALLVLGSALFAVGDVMFVNPYHLAPGGVYGLANVFNAMWGWKISLAGICMDIPLLIIGTIILGPKFGVKTVISVILIPVFTYIVETCGAMRPSSTMAPSSIRSCSRHCSSWTAMSSATLCLTSS